MFSSCKGGFILIFDVLYNDDTFKNSRITNNMIMVILEIEIPYNIGSWTKRDKMYNNANIDITAKIWVTVIFLNFKNIKKLIVFINAIDTPQNEIFI